MISLEVFIIVGGCILSDNFNLDMHVLDSYHGISPYHEQAYPADDFANHHLHQPPRHTIHTP